MSPIFIRIKHLGTLRDVVVPQGESATLGDLKEAVWQALRVPLEKQRFLMPGVRLPNADSTVLRDSLPKGATFAASPLPSAAPPMFMLIGNPEVPVMEDSCASRQSPAASAALAEAAASLVCIPQERPEGLYACSYASGNVSQEAYYCRTCADAGFADPQHFFCFGCAEVCHAGHETEHWGLHTFLRCDCCTHRCCHASSAFPEQGVPRAPATPAEIIAEMGDDDADDASPTSSAVAAKPRRCHFVVSSATNAIPSAPLAVNGLNRYPNETKTWCYCRGSDALPEDSEDALNCLLCHNCFYFSHMTRLHTDTFLLVPCYAETSGFNTLGYRCKTCDGGVFCPPCIIHCHRGHDVDEEPVVFDHQSPNIASRELKCGCGNNASTANASLCTISHDVQETRLIDLGQRPGLTAGVTNGLVPQWMARQLVGDDELCAFVCASCMMEHPWLWDTDLPHPAGSSSNSTSVAAAVGDLTSLRRCWRGVLPQGRRPAVSTLSSSVVPCRRRLSESTAVTPKSTLRTASSPLTPSFTPPTASSVEFSASCPFPYHGMLVAEEFFRFLCQCSDCQAAFSKVTPRNQGAPSQQHLFISYEDACTMCSEVIERGNGFLCVTCELAGFTSLMCEACATNVNIKARHSRDAPAAAGHGVHEFVQDTLDNLWRVFGAQLLKDDVVDRDTREWMLQHWDHGSTRDVVLELLRESAFGARAVPTTVSPADSGEVSPLPTDNEPPNAKKRPRDDDQGGDGNDREGGQS